ncbi:hypothetical protein OLX02_09840 [Novosphingobium sp. KCTC 2891]|uniref:hypothetical protein n=1 Tax=Novosphingobium sp. KCTC 2891 TaxID=2989730 RepID=UPI0022225350|nr:hypothetical protein [Novosphingobium sp. KCTC 2891]MCW1383124.1 hypothetical protein [Novosphingobium sp. KCTC 2891]
MTRRVPISPERREAALDRALDLAAAPRVPSGLAARIAREAVRLPQLPPEVAPAPQVEPVPAVPAMNGPAAVAVLPSRREPRRWLLGAGAGFAAIAAGIAAVAMVGGANEPAALIAPPAPMAALPASGPAPAAPAAPFAPAVPFASAVPQSAGQGSPALSQPTRLAGPSATPVTAQRRAAPAATVADNPVVPAAAAPAALAVATPPSSASPSASSSGPVARPDDEPAAPIPGARGQMGPFLPQGYGYTGGVPGTIPQSAPVTMSGGPGGPGGGPGMGGPGPRRF